MCIIKEIIISRLVHLQINMQGRGVTDHGVAEQEA